jgi:hypothetical protein
MSVGPGWPFGLERLAGRAVRRIASKATPTPRGVEEVVAAFSQHGKRVSGDADDHQPRHKREIEREDDEQPLCSGHK